MVRSRLVGAWVFAAAVILSAPFTQQLFAYVSGRWPDQSRALGIAATAVPAALVCLVVLRRIRERRLLRYTFVALALVLGAAYTWWLQLTFTEGFHFVQYGVLAVLYHRARIAGDDWSIVAVPMLAGAIAGSLDEWFQWFIPIRAGEARDVVVNLVATACGLLVGIAMQPPARLRAALDRHSRAIVVTHAAAALTVFTAFFYVVHVGHEVHDPEIGAFRSRYTAEQLATAARDRAMRWRAAPPVVQRRVGREDHYLTEALWRVRRRNEAWSAGDVATAWRENRILEKFYAPVLETPTYADPAGHRWPAAQRAEAAARAGEPLRPHASDAYAYPLYIWPDPF